MSENICLDCGICCQAMFSRADLVEGDHPDALEAAGVRLQTIGVTRSLAMSCTGFRGGCCSVYEIRPKVCRSFRCALLRKYESGEVPLSEARSLIGQVKALSVEVQPELDRLADAGPGHSYRFLCARVVEKYASPDVPAAVRREHGPFLLKAASLNVLLTRHFYVQSSKRSPGSGPDFQESERV